MAVPMLIHKIHIMKGLQNQLFRVDFFKIELRLTKV
jgi:hypothetical protein